MIVVLHIFKLVIAMILIQLRLFFGETYAIDLNQNYANILLNAKLYNRNDKC